MRYKRASTLLLMLMLSLCSLPSAALAEEAVTPASKQDSLSTFLPEKPETLLEESDALPEELEVLAEEAAPSLERMKPPPIGQEPTEPAFGEASNFEEMKLWLSENKNGSGVLTLKSDIIVPKGEDFLFAYFGSKDPDSLIIEAGEHSIYVEGNLALNPCLTVRGNGGENGIFRVAPSGQLELIGVQLIGQEGVPALVQEEGSILICSDFQDIDETLPTFSLVGELVRSNKLVAKPEAALFPVMVSMVEMREGFDPALLPETDPSECYGDPFAINYDIIELPVVWDKATFPVQREDGTWPRTIIKGSYAGDVLLHGETPPFCLVVFPEPNRLFFERCWVERSSWGSVTIILNARGRGSGGQVQLQSSMDGETWRDIEEPYLDEERLEWYLYSDNYEGELPRYFSLILTTPDGSVSYSDTLVLGEDDIFGSIEVDGGRGGETSPGEGGGHLPNLPEKPTDPEGEGDVEVPEKPTNPEGEGDVEVPEKPTDSEGEGDVEVPKKPSDPENGGGINAPREPPKPEDGEDAGAKPPTKDDDNQPSKEGNGGGVTEIESPSTPKHGEIVPPLSLVLLKIPLIQVKEFKPSALPNAVEASAPDAVQSMEHTSAVPIPPEAQEQPKFYAPSQEMRQKQVQSDVPSPKISEEQSQSDAPVQGGENDAEQVDALKQGIVQKAPQVDAVDQETAKVSGGENAKVPLSQSEQIALGSLAVLIVIVATLLIGRRWKP